MSESDVILAMAWKIGLIDHHGSEAAKTIKYLQGWPTVLKDRYGRDYSEAISYLANNMPAILREIARGNGRYLFDLHPRLDSFGPVYAVNVLFFITHGKYPIYDQYAHVAARAISQGLPPESHVNYKAIQQWTDYKEYMNLLSGLSEACPEQFRDSAMFVSRTLDRALWVYGHFFQTKPSGVSVTQSSGGIHHSPDSVMAVSNRVLVGRICDLSSTTTDGWRRREINVKRGSDGYPDVRDIIHLIDSSGAQYPDLPFIKGARLPGHTCLGQPGALKPWFTRRFPFGEVKTENVYFEPTDRSNEYRILSESEWKASRALK